MATIEIEVEDGREEEYLENILEQLRQGYTSGYVDHENYWSITRN